MSTGFSYPNQSLTDDTQWLVWANNIVIGIRKHAGCKTAQQALQYRLDQIGGDIVRSRPDIIGTEWSVMGPFGDKRTNSIGPRRFKLKTSPGYTIVEST